MRVSRCGQPPAPFEVYRASILAESVAAVAAVRGILNAHGGGRARVHQAPTSHNLRRATQLLPLLWTGLVVGTGVAPPPCP